MSDTIIVAIITTIGSIITAVITVRLGKTKDGSKTLRIPSDGERVKSKDIILTGNWSISEKYEKSLSIGNVTIVQKGEKISGQIICSDTADYLNQMKFQIVFYGNVVGKDIEFHATEVVLPSEYSGGYNLDHWSGKIIDQNTITGTSVDDGGVEGSFEMKRVNISNLVQ